MKNIIPGLSVEDIIGSGASDPKITFKDIQIQTKINNASIVTGSPLAGIFTSQEKIYGIGYTGCLPPGAFLLCCPFEHQNRFNEFAGVHCYRELMRRIFGSESYSEAPAVSSPFFIVRAGETIRFNAPMKGVACVQLTYWTGNSVGGYSLLDELGFWPTGFMRLILSPSHGQDLLKYSKTPFTNYTGYNASLPEMTSYHSSDAGYLFVGPSVKTVSIFVSSSTVKKITTETGTFEVYWLGPGYGLASGEVNWYHNDADDWDVAGRGGFSSSHDVEVYAVPGWARGICVKSISGDTTIIPIFSLCE